MPSAFSRWFRTTSRGSSPKCCAFLTSSLGESGGRCLGQCGDWRLWFSSSWELNQSHLLSMIQDIDQRICPTVMQAGAYVTLEDYGGELHQVVGKNQQLFDCTENEHARNRTDRKFDTRLRFPQWYGCPTKDDVSVLYDRVPDVYNLLSQHSVSDETVPSETEACNSDTKWMWTTMTSSFFVIWESQIPPRKQIKARMKPTVTYSRSSPALIKCQLFHSKDAVKIGGVSIADCIFADVTDVSGQDNTNAF